jgi:hypothetical protein
MALVAVVVVAHLHMSFQVLFIVGLGQEEVLEFSGKERLD